MLDVQKNSPISYHTEFIRHKMEIPILLNYALYRDTRRMQEFSASMRPGPGEEACRGMHSMKEQFYACSYGNIRKINHGVLLYFVQAG